MIFPILVVTLQKSWWCLTDATDIKTDIFLAQKKILGCDQCTLESFKKNLVLEEIVFCRLNQQIMPSKIKDLIFYSSCCDETEDNEHDTSVSPLCNLKKVNFFL